MGKWLRWALKNCKGYQLKVRQYILRSIPGLTYMADLTPAPLLCPAQTFLNHHSPLSSSAKTPYQQHFGERPQSIQNSRQGLCHRTLIQSIFSFNNIPRQLKWAEVWRNTSPCLVCPSKGKAPHSCETSSLFLSLLFILPQSRWTNLWDC